MDSFDIATLKIKKSNAILRYRRLQKVATLFRFVELLVVLIILSRFTTLLPVTFDLSGEYLRGVLVTVLSSRSVFVIGNAIVLILYLKSGQFSTQSDPESKINFDLHDDEFIGNHRERNCEIQKENREKRRKPEKEIKKAAAITNCVKERKIRRSNSENSMRDKENRVKVRSELRRSVTESRLKSVSSSYAEEEMSSEEFRRTVEAFIARQQRNLRGEEELLAIVPSC